MRNSYLQVAHPWYMVVVDEKVVGSFQSSIRLTWEQQWEIADGYEEAHKWWDFDKHQPKEKQ